MMMLRPLSIPLLPAEVRTLRQAPHRCRLRAEVGGVECDGVVERGPRLALPRACVPGARPRDEAAQIHRYRSLLRHRIVGEAAEVEQHTGLVALCPAVMARRYVKDGSRREFGDGAVVHAD